MGPPLNPTNQGSNIWASYLNQRSAKQDFGTYETVTCSMKSGSSCNTWHESDFRYAKGFRHDKAGASNGPSTYQDVWSTQLDSAGLRKGWICAGSSAPSSHMDGATGRDSIARALVVLDARWTRIRHFFTLKSPTASPPATVQVDRRAMVHAPETASNAPQDGTSHRSPQQAAQHALREGWPRLRRADDAHHARQLMRQLSRGICLLRQRPVHMHTVRKWQILLPCGTPCQDCAGGRISASPVRSGCTSCAAGKYSDDSLACKRCGVNPDGTTPRANPHAVFCKFEAEGPTQVTTGYYASPENTPDHDAQQPCPPDPTAQVQTRAA